MKWIVSLTLAIGVLVLSYLAWILFLMGVNETSRMDRRHHPLDD
jgi:hypothetical protein